MSKRIPLLLTALLVLGSAWSQRTCGSMDVLEAQLEEDPKRAVKMEQIEDHLRDLELSGSREVNGVVAIPVVVHVLYNTTSENISDAQILSQITVLNDDFRRTNSDADETWSQAADSEIEFCMASSDPEGNATNGIVRTATSVSAFGTNDAMKSSSTGGADAWPAGDYLNVWVCDISGGILGYAQFPGGAASTDGIVIDYQYFGTIGTASAPFDLGRTATHEVGHWLNLRHIWGDGNCNADDFVTDTPSSDGANYGCATGHVSCQTTDMIENYMDYSDDGCMNLYTAGQKNRMRALFESGGYRSSLLNSSGCGPVTPATCDDGIQNGDETGVDCGGADCAPCTCDGVDVTVTVNFDNYPEETSWEISSGNTTVFNGGTYPNAPDGSTSSFSQCLADGCYTFTMSDSYGDGLCCSYGTGSYTVSDESDNILASGASFGGSESTDFCVTSVGGPEPTCEDGEQNGDETGVDCGGADCPACATCDDGIQNGTETGVDCGGSCTACATCDDGIQNGTETGVDCGGSDCSPCESLPCTYGTVDSESFESGWGIWNDGGSDCRRNRRDRNYANGTYAIRLRDNTSTSNMTTDNLNLSGYEELTVSFDFIASSMENNEDFWLQISLDGGSSYTTVATYVSGSSFSNNQNYTSEVLIPGPFTDNTRVRFRCDASGNNDKVYLDDVLITGCVEGGRWGQVIVPSGEANSETTEMIPDVFTMMNVYPNPADDVVNVSFVLQSDATYQWWVTDIQGRIVWNETRTASQGEQKLKLQTSSMQAGTYLMHLISNQGKSSKRFIISR